MEDATHALLTDFVDSISNLPSEVSHVLIEVAYLDYAKPQKDSSIGPDPLPPVPQTGNGEDGVERRWYSVEEARRRAATKHASIVRHSHKPPNNLLVHNPKEAAVVERGSAHYEDAIALTLEKEQLINRARSLVTRHLTRLNAELSRLEQSTGVSVPDFHRDTGTSSATGLDLSQLQVTSGIQRGSSLCISRTGVAQLSTAAVTGTPTPNVDRNRRRTGALLPTPTSCNFLAPNLASLPPSHHPHATSLTSTSVYAPTAATALPSRQRSRLTESAGTPGPPSKRRRPNRKARVDDEDEDDEADDPEPDAEGGLEEADASNAGDDALYCFCQRVSYGEMIGCDNDNCKYEWFHLACLGLKATPTGQWYCPSCRDSYREKKTTGTRGGRRRN